MEMMRLRLSSSGEFVEEEFYEEIEAPKFVDLGLKEPYCPDDRYWFCSRVGCDEKHLEEIDSEVVYKNFVLRVMASRSPNVKLHKKALRSRDMASDQKKCSMSAPPKRSKPQIPRLAVTSSVSRKLFECKDKGLLRRAKIQTPTTTPSASSRGKQVAAKYNKTMTASRMTTKLKFEPDGTRNASPRMITTKLRTTAAGDGHLPNSALQRKKPTTSRPKAAATTVADQNSGGGNSKTPITRICERMKKLELSSSSSSRRVLRPAISSTSSKKNTKTMKDEHQSKLSRDQITSGSNHRVKKQVRFAHCEDDDHHKGGGTPLSKCSKLSAKRDDDAKAAAAAAAAASSVCPEQTTSTAAESMNAALLVVAKKPNEEPTCIADDEEDKENAPVGQNNSSTTINNHKKSSEGGIKVAKMVTTGGETQVIADKENAPATEDVVGEKNSSSSTINNNKKSSKGIKVAKVATTGKVQVIAVQYKKPKLTNPKPFRLRTDERGILKEAAAMGVGKNCPPHDTAKPANNTCERLKWKTTGRDRIRRL